MSNLAASSQTFLDNTPLTKILNIPETAIQDCARATYRLLAEGAFQQAEIFARGLVAADHRHWYYRTLLATILVKTARLPEAITTLDEGLRLKPRNAELLKMRAVLTGAPSCPPSATPAR